MGLFYLFATTYKLLIIAFIMGVSYIAVRANPELKIPVVVLLFLGGLYFSWGLYSNTNSFDEHILPKCFKVIMDSAVVYEASQGEWPEDIFNEIPELEKTTYNSFWIFSSNTYRDSLGESTFLIKASLKKDINYGEVPKGHFITCNNHGDICYSHPSLASKFMKAYLNYATYIGPDSLLSAYPIEKKQY